MAEVTPPAPKKAKRCTPVARVTAEEQAKQFRDLYADSGVLFCSYCAHSIDYVRVDTIKDHLNSKKHCQRKASKLAKADTSGPSTSKQVTLQSVVKYEGPNRTICLFLYVSQSFQLCKCSYIIISIRITQGNSHLLSRRLIC